MEAPTASVLRDGQQLRLMHGPIDIVMGCTGDSMLRRQVFNLAVNHFQQILETLVGELPLLRCELPQTDSSLTTAAQPQGAIARRMWCACAPYSSQRVTPMVAVAGAVADELLESVRSVEGVNKIWINNGGDIALHLREHQTFDCGIIDDVSTGIPVGTITLGAGDGIGGVATSGCAGPGQGGRSFSLGIADSVTVLAASAAAADVAATLIGNAVDLPNHVNVMRQPADSINPDSDLHSRPVVTEVGVLTRNEIDLALSRGEQCARRYLQRGLICGAVLSLRGQRCMIGHVCTALANRGLESTTESAREMMA